LSRIPSLVVSQKFVFRDSNGTEDENTASKFVKNRPSSMYTSTKETGKESF